MSLMRTMLARQASLASRPLAMRVAAFHTRGPLRSSSHGEATTSPGDKAKQLIDCIQRSSRHELFVYTQKFNLVAAPLAVMLSPTIFNLPVDLGLGVIIPVHMQIGLTGVIEDYVPKSSQSLAFSALLLVTGLTTLGLLKINLCGVGITESAKSLWREKKA